MSSSSPVIGPAYLTDIGPIDSSIFNPGPVSANGQEYAHSFYLDPQCSGGIGPTTEFSFDLKRAYATLTGFVAESDDSRTVTEYQIDIIGDGKNIYSQRLKYGETLTVSADVKAVLNLEVKATLLTGTDAQCFFQGKSVFGDLAVR
jgi:hypothetical protein